MLLFAAKRKGRARAVPLQRPRSAQAHHTGGDMGLQPGMYLPLSSSNTLPLSVSLSIGDILIISSLLVLQPLNSSHPLIQDVI